MYSDKNLFASLNRSRILGKACIYGLSRGFIFVSGVQMELKIIFLLAGFLELTRFSGISLHFQKRISGNFYRTVCFDEVVFIRADCFFIAFEFVRKYYLWKICKISEKRVRKSSRQSGVHEEKTFGTQREEVESLGVAYEEIRDGYRIVIETPLAATDLIVNHTSVFRDYEIVKGGMDDVFITVTGKKLGGEQ